MITGAFILAVTFVISEGTVITSKNRRSSSAGFPKGFNNSSSIIGAYSVVTANGSTTGNASVGSSNDCSQLIFVSRSSSISYRIANFLKSSNPIIPFGNSITLLSSNSTSPKNFVCTLMVCLLSHSPFTCITVQLTNLILCKYNDLIAADHFFRLQIIQQCLLNYARCCSQGRFIDKLCLIHLNGSFFRLYIFVAGFQLLEV